jgi:hypothetical protein
MKKLLKFLGIGLFSNRRLIDESEEHSYISAFVVLFISLILSLLPIFVSVMNTNGGALVTASTNAGMDNTLTVFSKYLSDNKDSINLKIDENGKVDVDNSHFADGTKEYVVYVKQSVDGVDVDKEVLAVRICSNDQASTWQQHYAQGKHETNDIVSDTPRSYLIITEDNLYLGSYLNTATNTLSEDKLSITTAATLNNSITGFHVNAKNTDFTTLYGNGYSDATTNWANLLTLEYNTVKYNTLWINLGILLGINAGIVLIVSLLLMILTRLKSSQGVRLNYPQAFKVICFSSLSPAIIGMAIGFFMSMFAQIGFVLCLGLRSTFLSMKASRPDNE